MRLETAHGHAPIPVPDREAPLRAILPALAAHGARYDAQAAFPADSVACLRAAGLDRRFAPRESGGAPFADGPAENRCLMAALRLVGRADLSLGRIFEGHVNALKLFAWYGTGAQKAVLRDRLARGAVFGVWATEAPPGVTLAAEAAGGRLSGAKLFATGAGSLTHAIVTARSEAGQTRLVIVPADEPARTDLSGWKVRGMRATVSGRYDLEDLAVGPADLLGHPDDYGREPRFTAGAWRFLAVQLGGIEALLAETRDAMSEAARQDPLQRAKFADAVVATRTAYLWVREAAERAAGESPDAPDFVRLARGVVERAALDVMELSARIVGTRSAFEGQRIDKITRDLSLYLRQAHPDQAKDLAAKAWLARDVWDRGDRLW
jgi:alkylation response protein AidB-like acyl-CoA dehydrogenase